MAWRSGENRRLIERYRRVDQDTSFRWMTLGEIDGAMRELFARCPAPDALRAALDAEPSFTRYGNRYCVHPAKRGDRLAAELWS